MLMMGFNLGSYAYAIPCNGIVEVIPFIETRPLPGSPDYVAGIFDYRGNILPTIDLKMVAMKTPCSRTFGTRIMIINFQADDGTQRMLGLIAENVTTTFNANDADFEDSGVELKDSPYLGKIVRHEGELVQIVATENLLDRNVQETIFKKNEK